MAALLKTVFTAAIAIGAGVFLSVRAPAQTADELSPPVRAPALLEDLLQRADRESLYEDPEWLALLHYDREWLPPQRRSRVITPSFFLSDIGDRNPRAELHATLSAFFDPIAVARGDEHPQCAFIARRHWLTQRLQLRDGDLPHVECAEYQRWRAGLDPRGLTLIFPEGFMNNPASLFGHTLLRVDIDGDESGQELLGWAVDFTAKSGGELLPLYMAKGVFGFYPGIFGVRPYYQQLKRYADWENRDIWEYRLNVDRGQLDFLLMHLWELRDVELPYYFFSKNCSYELLRLLDVAIDGLDASRHFHSYVIPVDTVRAIVRKPNLVKSVRYRPSPETELRARLRSLPENDRDYVQTIVDGRLPPDAARLAQLPPAQRARILDTAYDQLRYEYLAGQVSEGTSRGLSRRILIARARIGTLPKGEESDRIEIEVPKVRPDQGHGSARFSVVAGWRDGDPFVDLELRPALHSLMDNAGGYPEHMQIGFLDTRLRIYPESGRVRLQQLTLFQALSLSPRSHVFKPWAWSVATGLRTRRAPDRRGFDDISVWGSEIGIGAAWDVSSTILFYGLPDLRLDVGPDLDDNVSFGPGARVGVLLGERETPWKGHFFGEVTRFAAGDTTTALRAGVELRVTTSRNTAVLLEASGNRLYDDSWLEGAFRLNLYF